MSSTDVLNAGGLESSITSQSDDVNDLDGFISLGGAGDDGTNSDVDEEPSYNPPASQRQSSVSAGVASKKASSFIDKIQQQSKKRRKEKGGDSSSNKNLKKSKR